MPIVHRDLARVLKGQGDVREAELVLEAGHELDPADHAITEALAITQRARGRWRREIGTLGRYLAARGDEATVGLKMRLDRLIRRVVTKV